MNNADSSIKLMKSVVYMQQGHTRAGTGHIPTSQILSTDNCACLLSLVMFLLRA